MQKILINFFLKIWPVSFTYDWQICIIIGLFIYVKTVIQKEGNFTVYAIQILSLFQSNSRIL